MYWWDKHYLEELLIRLMESEDQKKRKEKMKFKFCV